MKVVVELRLLRSDELLVEGLGGISPPPTGNAFRFRVVTPFKPGILLDTVGEYYDLSASAADPYASAARGAMPHNASS